MGAEAAWQLPDNNTGAIPPLVVGLQPLALVDQVARVDWSLLDAIPGECGGSQRVTAKQLEEILAEINLHILPLSGETIAVRTLAGGSVANTIRGLAGGFHVFAAIVGTRGDDEQGQMFHDSMKMSGVHLDRLRVKKGPTGQADELTGDDLHGAKWILLNGYGLYGEQLVERAVDLAKKEGVKVAMDLSSFEVIRNFRPRLMKLLASQQIDLCFANEDEARELMSEMISSSRGAGNFIPEQSLAFLAKYCSWSVVMLGSKGCIACHRDEIVRVPAIEAGQVVDTTGAGDLFTSGFLFGMLNQLPLEDCCKIGCCAGAAVVRALGAEITKENLRWMHKQLDMRNLSSKGIMQALD